MIQNNINYNIKKKNRKFTNKATSLKKKRMWFYIYCLFCQGYCCYFLLKPFLSFKIVQYHLFFLFWKDGEENRPFPIIWAGLSFCYLTWEEKQILKFLWLLLSKMTSACTTCNANVNTIVKTTDHSRLHVGCKSVWCFAKRVWG